MSFYERLEGLCIDNGIAMSNLGQFVKVGNNPISRATVSGWREGAVPRNSTIKAIADYFHVDVNWLATGKHSTGVNPFESVDLLPLSSQEEEIIRMFRSATEMGKIRILSQVLAVWEQDAKNE